ncbi:hypothetical protein [Piscinibacter sp. XHJ-5]|uniref:hypothetical protein n=1 Tax=Piscinibacter sp. XHJ-5 TaxID=3037797 RepID=UPI002452C13F|nr:hypothetical protein [Piscinibacter sp. XHJ-5]
MLSRDKGFDPLVVHLNKNGVKCRRIEAIGDLVPAVESVAEEEVGVLCGHCSKANTIEHHGGRWCSHCGRFASPPDPTLLPSRQPGYRDATREAGLFRRFQGEDAWLQDCGWCHQRVDMTGGIYDDGEWMCGGCIARYAG